MITVLWTVCLLAEKGLKKSKLMHRTHSRLFCVFVFVWSSLRSCAHVRSVCVCMCVCVRYLCVCFLLLQGVIRDWAEMDTDAEIADAVRGYAAGLRQSVASLKVFF
jgi:hypothetical protein